MDSLAPTYSGLAGPADPMTLGDQHVPAASREICAVVVTHHPVSGVQENLQSLVRECEVVVVVDNGSGSDVARSLAALPGTQLIALPENRGVAVALNIGVARAADLGAAWVLTFDQDSVPEPGYAASIWATHERQPRAAVVGPKIVEPALKGREYRWLRPGLWGGLCFQRLPCRDADLSGVSMVITSGSLIEVECWRRLGGFDERLFVDYVDTDYCLRCCADGRTIAVSAGARLEHRLGNRKRHNLFGRVFYPTNHPPIRHYYIARNRMLMYRRHASRFPHWFFFDLAAAGLWLFRVLAFESNKVSKLRAMVLGTWDGLRGRVGACVPARAARF